MQLSIIIVNYNVQYFLEQCLHAVARACLHIDAEILVVDNHSTDDSKTYLTPKFPNVQFFWSDKNLGFGKANNKALQQAKGDYVLFLNPDTIVSENCFVQCLQQFKTNQHIGAIGVCMVDGSGQFLPESKRGLPTAWASFCKMVGLTKLLPTSSIFAQYYQGHLPATRSNEVAVLAGAFMMLSRAAIEATQGFDETFFMYGEDVDLSYRITKAGLLNYYLAQTTIVHFKGESTQKKSASYSQHFYGAMRLFVDKHYQKKPAQLVAMKAAIGVGKCMADVGRLFASNKITQHHKHEKILVVGAAEDVASATNILDHQQIQYEVFLINAKTAFQSIIAATMAQQYTQIAACIGKIGYQFYIAFLMQMPKNWLLLFHYTNSESMVGSNNKNERGVFISMQQ
ncbi:glycosyltransferase family 2 protein [Ferruginibacter yonginensis]|uniref:Glycosyltransferase family 2 protein n=1 Tax=Ferruginibacter yonginensis TaxID=1310416 RepID=A0ABV8QRK9_9BACT